ncbi:MAG: polysaccharide biosynthesis protein [Lachnospiraceae bacterium]|nr:polysaccharide biosynthesis protein [Lachnospiraceae bacterium]
MNNSVKSSQGHKQYNFLIQGGILAIAGIVVRIIGMIYRVPLTHIIGDRGNSLYSNAYDVYSIILIISSYSLPVAVSKMMAGKYSVKEYENADRIFKGALIYALIVGSVAAVFCYAAAPILVKAEGAVPVLRVLAPVIFFSAILGTFRGLFQGQGTMIPTSLSQILEQIMNAVVSVLAAWLLVRPFTVSDPEDLLPRRGAMGSTLGTGAGVLAGLIFVVIVYFIYRPDLKRRTKRGQKKPVDSYGVILKSIVLTVTPMVLSAGLYNVSPFIDNYMIYDIMDKLGYSQEFIQNIHGIYAGRYLLMVNIPVAFANALSSSMIPTISAAKSSGNESDILRKAGLTIKVSMMIAIPCAIGLAVLGGPFLEIILPTNQEFPYLAEQLLMGGSTFVIFFAYSTVTNAILQATDHLNLPVIHSAIALTVHVILTFVLIRFLNLNVWGLMISTISFAVVLCILNYVSLKHKIGLKMEWKSGLLIPLVSSLIMGAVCFFVYQAFLLFTSSRILAFLFAFLNALIIYVVAMVLLRGVTEEELLNMPKGQMIVRILKKVHLLHD